jgi:predicted ribonuclease YlaK
MVGVNRPNKMTRKERRQLRGEELLLQDNKKQFENDWKLDWFQPKGLQIDCIEAIDKNVFTIIDAPSGCGKSTLALWWALTEMKNRSYNQLVFIKNPTEAGDDQIGYLSGSETDKLMAHMDTTKRIFWELVSKNKFENDVSKDKIRLTIPNFLLGTTFDNAVVILDEVQTMSPNTVKLLTERCGKGTKYIMLGDSQQRYSVKKRGDGFADFIDRTTVPHHGLRWSKFEPYVGYVRMSRHDNQRSEGSKFINKLYEE